MICEKCGGNILLKHGVVKIDVKWIGTVATEKEVGYWECNRCGELLFGPSAAMEIERAQKKAEKLYKRRK